MKGNDGLTALLLLMIVVCLGVIKSLWVNHIDGLLNRAHEREMQIGGGMSDGELAERLGG